MELAQLSHLVKLQVQRARHVMKHYWNSLMAKVCHNQECLEEWVASPALYLLALKSCLVEVVLLPWFEVLLVEVAYSDQDFDLVPLVPLHSIVLVQL